MTTTPRQIAEHIVWSNYKHGPNFTLEDEHVETLARAYLDLEAKHLELEKELASYKDNDPEDYLTPYENELLTKNKLQVKEIAKLKEKIERLKKQYLESSCAPFDAYYKTCEVLNGQLEQENAKLKEKIEKLQTALQKINKEELNSQRLGGEYSKSAKISFEALKSIKK